MGFLPDVRKILKHLPAKRQTLFFSATMPPPIQGLTRELLRDPVMINLARKAAPAVGIRQAVYPVRQDLKTKLLLTLLERNLIQDALVFTRTKHRTNRLWEFLSKRGVSVARIHGNRSQGQRTEALAGFKAGTYRVLVATDIAARGIDVEALGHVVNFDVPLAADDYIHRVGRTARAELTGEAFTFVSPEEEQDLRNIERAIHKALPRVTLPDFDYSAKPAVRFEVPIGERMAQMREQKAQERARAKVKEERRAAHHAAQSGRPEPRPGPGRPGAPARPSVPGGNQRRRNRWRRGKGP
jgi:ATP-dependent RNA helicase RhlE